MELIWMYLFGLITYVGVDSSYQEQHMLMNSIYVPNLPEDAYIKLGDFNIGVLIPVHVRSMSSFCGTQIRDLGLLQRLEALVFAIEEINRSNSLLPNHTLGYVIFDDCYADLTALAQALHFSRTHPPDDCAKDDLESDVEFCDSDSSLSMFDVVGVIGSESSISTVQAANLLTTFQIPQISYLATNPSLSNKDKYPHFQRTVPSDSTQAKVIISLLMQFNWTYIYVIYSEGAYGEGLYRALERTLEENSYDRDICFVEPFIIREDFVPYDYITIVHQMLQERLANVCLVIAPNFEAQELMKASASQHVEGRFTWIASDAWARSIHSLGNLVSQAYGLLSVNIYATQVQRFDQHFKNMRADSDTSNPWVNDYWEQLFNCTRTNSTTRGLCRDDMKLSDHITYHPEATTSLVFDAVMSYAVALNWQVKSKCVGLKDGDILDCVRRNLSQQLRSVVFTGESGDLVSFNENGDRPTSYGIFNVQRSNTSDFGYELVHVGTWNQYKETLKMDQDKIQWSRGEKPLSNCSHPCGVGEGMELQQKRCCWACVPCQDNQYTRRKLDIQTCFDCPEGTWPDPETRKECHKIQPTYLTWEESMGMTMMCLAVFGLMLSAAVVFLYILNNNHQLIKACSRELSYFMLFGIAASYAFVFTLIVKPTDVVCFISQLGVVTSFTMVYAPLTIKTIRIWRIFEAGRHLNRRPRCVQWSAQLIISMVAVVLHAALVVVWSVFDPPYPEHLSSGQGRIDLVCRFQYGPFISSMCFNVILLMVCSVFAFKTRKLPDNFNESRFISFCAFSAVTMWVAFIPGYFLTDSIYRVLFLALMLCANGFILHGGLFAPKIYAIYFVDKTELNLRANFAAGCNMSERSNISHIGHYMQEVATPGMSVAMGNHQKRILSATIDATHNGHAKQKCLVLEAPSSQSLPLERREHSSVSDILTCVSVSRKGKGKVAPETVSDSNGNIQQSSEPPQLIDPDTAATQTYSYS